MIEKNNIRSSSVILAAILLDGEDERAFESSLAELERLTDTAYREEDAEIESGLRPHALGEYVGQERAKESLKILIKI